MKNIESNLTESRKYKPNAQFSSNANLNPRLLNQLHSLYKKDPDKFWANLANKEIKWIKRLKMFGNSIEN